MEVLYPPSEAAKRKYHVSMNITRLPSARALESWLAMVGLERIVRATCHRRVSRDLALAGEEGYEIGKSL